ncbi:hypothetical protein BGX26_001658 [Mortierella sp. AD094]|nr:hypothetical protein BGX26_001658 [Mortierella sp. AD094]
MACKFSSLIRSADDPSLSRAHQGIVEFEARWSTHNEGKLWKYLKDRYFSEERRKRWMKSYRVAKFYAGLDTNNYVKSWHNHLKSQFLRGHTNCRGDRLIYILSHDVDDLYQALAMRSVVLYGRHSKGKRMDIMQERYSNGKTRELSTLVTAGDVDEIVPTMETLRLFEMLQSARQMNIPQVLKIIKHAGHLPQEGNPSDFVKVASYFIRKVCLGSLPRESSFGRRASSKDSTAGPQILIQAIAQATAQPSTAAAADLALRNVIPNPEATVMTPFQQVQHSQAITSY